MASLVELAPTPSRSWPGIAAQEKSDGNRPDAFLRRYEMLLRLNRCLTSARPEDLVTSIAAQLRPIVDFDLLDVLVNPASLEADQSVCDCQIQSSSATGGPGLGCLPRGDEIKSQCSLPLISRGSKLGFFVLGRFGQSSFSGDDIEFLTQVAGQVAIFIDNSM